VSGPRPLSTTTSRSRAQDDELDGTSTLPASRERETDG
jgi:hypothetical protein